MGVLAARSPTVVTMCVLGQAPDGSGARIVRRTFTLTGRDAVFVESLVAMHRRRSPSGRDRPDDTWMEHG